MMKSKICFLLFGIFANVCTAYNILVIMGHPGNSHLRVFVPFFKELGERGHHLTVISYAAIKGKNIRAVQLAEGLKEVMPLNEITGARSEKYFGAHLLYSFSKSYEEGLKSRAFQDFLKENNSYDVVLAEMFNSNAFYGLAKRFDAPLVGLSSCAMLPWHAQWFGSSDNPSYIPVLFMDYPVRMSFAERVENTVMLLMNKWWWYSLMETPGKILSQKYIGEETPDLYTTSLFLVNSHHTLHGARPLTPSIVEVGGIHIEKAKKLPENLERWIEESGDGVIYFSLGSMIKSNTLAEETRKIFANVFSRLPQRVLWKWENDSMPEKPKNVMVQKWLPQRDVLCHPNVKAFIGHGGLLGTTEAIHCGVPLIIMPQFGDQHLNAKAVESQGVGVILQLHDTNEEKLSNAINKVLSPEISRQTKALSERFKDRPQSPIDTAIYWVEHVTRHKGGYHMRSAAIDLPFYQYFLFDVVAFLAVLILTFVYIVYLSLKFFLSFRPKTNVKQKSS
ncbi:UDP-glycosyltransferase UGT5-like [Cylas formicarius]|uniref:UDP-glycosyltransferase UGT5-like n=1 Tax=Cylas formicarius TaxID=197179 RepID=UPI00295842C3|nr:UDP-glycosyltransferase UGT5-like [Cylas formicarius]